MVINADGGRVCPFKKHKFYFGNSHYAIKVMEIALPGGEYKRDYY